MRNSRRPSRAALVAGVALLLTLGWLAAGNPAEAVSNSVSIAPATATVTPGGSVTLELRAEPPAEGVAAWVVEVGFDPAIVTTTTAQCDSMDGPPGSTNVFDCETIDTDEPPDGTEDAVAVVGGVVFADVMRWGDVDCNELVKPADSTAILQHDAGQTPSPKAGCPKISASALPQDLPARRWGDVDCNGLIKPADSTAILQADAGQTPEPKPECARIGQFLEIGWSLQAPAVLASITFDAVGAAGQCSALTVRVGAFTDITGQSTNSNPTVTNGQICIQS